MNRIYRLASLAVLLVLFSCTTKEGAQVQASGEEPDLKQASAYNLQLGTGYMKRGQYKIAKDKFEKSIEQDPSNIEAYSTLALLLNMLNENDKAEDYYKQAIERDANNSWLRNNYGTFLCGLGKIDEAMAEFERAYKDPFYDTAYLAMSNAGSCLVKNGDYKRAEPLLRKALRSNEKLPTALLAMSELGINTKKYLMARAYIQRYHAIKKPSAESLWLQVQAEKGLKAMDHYIKYAKRLLKDFPDSKEAGYLNEMRDEALRR